jgi:hypothetical protein
VVAIMADMDDRKEVTTLGDSVNAIALLRG